MNYFPQKYWEDVGDLISFAIFMAKFNIFSIFFK